MANQVTKTASKVFATILLSVLIVSFAIFGTGPGILSSSSTNVAIVGDIKISPQSLASRVRNRAADLQEQVQLDMDEQTLITTFGLDYQVLQQMISEATVTAEATSLGLAASDGVIADLLQEVDAFQEPGGGGFSEAFMRQTLAANGLTVDDFLQTASENIISNQLVSSIGAGSPFPYFATEVLYKTEAEKRQATLLNFSADDVPDPENPSDEDLASYFEFRKGDFMSPARRSYSYILLKPEVFFDQVTVTEEDLEAEYAARLEEFITLEQRTILQVSVPDNATAEAIRTAIDEGRTFTEAATELTAFTADELSIGSKTENEVAEIYGDAAAAAVFDADLDTLVGPIVTDLGFTGLFYVTVIDPGSEKTLDEVRDRLELLAKTQKATDQMFELLPDVEDAVITDGALDLVAERLNLTLARVPLVDRNGVNEEGVRILSQSEETRILSEAFAAEQGGEPKMINIDVSDEEKGVFFLELREVLEPAEQSLEDVRGQVLDLWRVEEKQRLAGEVAEKGRQMLEEGLGPESIVNDLGGTSFEANNIARTASDSVAGRIAPNIRRLIFDLKKGDIGIEQSTDGYVVVRVNEVEEGDPAAAPGEILARQEALRGAFVGDILEQYQRYLTAKYPADINQQLLDQLFRNPVQQQFP